MFTDEVKARRKNVDEEFIKQIPTFDITLYTTLLLRIITHLRLLRTHVQFEVYYECGKLKNITHTSAGGLEPPTSIHTSDLCDVV